MYEKEKKLRKNIGLWVFIAFALYLTFANLSGVGLVEWILQRLYMIPGIVIGLSLHEFGHAFVADRLGDPTPRRAGRVTTNPLAHMDPRGMLLLLFAGFGWGIPVGINSMYFKNRKRGEIMVGFAGVTMNLIIAIVTAFVMAVLTKVTPEFNLSLLYQGSGLFYIIFQVLYRVMFINVVLMVFNLLPIPPLDGFGIITAIFNLERWQYFEEFYRSGLFIILILIITGMLDRILMPLITLILTPLIHIMQIFS